MHELAYYLRMIGELGVTGSLHQARKILSRRIGSPRQSQVTTQDILRLTGFSSAAELANHLRTRSIPVFFIDRDPQFYQSALTMCFPGEREKIIEAAGLIMSHTFDLLGSGPTQLDALKH